MTSSIKLFVENRCEIGEGLSVSSSIFLEEFNQYISSLDIDASISTVIEDILLYEFPSISKITRSSNGTIYSGISVKKSIEIIEECNSSSSYDELKNIALEKSTIDKSLLNLHLKGTEIATERLNRIEEDNKFIIKYLSEFRSEISMRLAEIEKLLRVVNNPQTEQPKDNKQYVYGKGYGTYKYNYSSGPNKSLPVLRH